MIIKLTRKFVSTAALALLSVMLASTALSQVYPDKPISILVGFPPGTSTDSIARIIGEKLNRDLGQPVIIKNKPGAGGGLALAELAKSKADGYTLALSASGPLGINPHIYKVTNYDALNDFDPIGQTSWLPFLLVTNKTKGLDTLQKLTDFAKANPDKLNYSSIGVGTTSHLLMAMLMVKTQTKITHVPYTGSSQSQQDVIGGNVDMTFDTLVSTLPHVKSGRLNAVGVSTHQRARLDPSIPTLEEQGVSDFNMGAWLGFVAPKGTDPVIVQKLHDQINIILKDPDVTEKLEALGAEVVTSASPQAFSTLIQNNYKVWGELVKQAGVEQK
ncbi:tripartite-type tricarboxylate transporter receptor subunit TctC [Jezberella montanilacus]|jgi:tripartite-type tricarboxylate transporter receptor subunit TctC|uniref:Tripartite-type tricarboxylate transporter receptor subunit TctC n=1 Tax=Jezberella montanilacus TaxID=323426 RepID=A0A2T0XGL0_9BURK|nr:tripartite tricarboxylate transporter substrate binding protein [Jezberella montanilacus]PRY98047.1 tripartite-type tricarboxylate transporter receptor subunit TctC [Jezberella montanilacus]